MAGACARQISVITKVQLHARVDGIVFLWRFRYVGFQPPAFENGLDQAVADETKPLAAAGATLVWVSLHVC